MMFIIEFNFFAFVFFFSLHKGNGVNLLYFSNFKVEQPVYGEENLIKDYVTLANGPEETLPHSYTVCSSVFVNFFTSSKAVIQLLKRDGTPWYLFDFGAARIYDKQSETLDIWYENPISGKNEFENFSKTRLLIVPHSWYHICMGLDTVSGLLRIVVNGKEVVNEEKDYFRDTTAWKPQSVVGKVLLFKGYQAGYWYQHRGSFSNLNIFRSMMSVEDMVTRTAGGEGCDTPGDYLRLTINTYLQAFTVVKYLYSWEEAQWNVTGNVVTGSIDNEQELCRRLHALQAFKSLDIQHI